MSKDCLVCERIAQIKKGVNPYFVTELETGYVVLGDHQFFRGYTLLLCKQHISELHQLEKSFKLKFLEEMSLVAEAVWKWVEPKSMNYEALGNAEPHLHWHLFPRHADDSIPTKPIWLIPSEKRYAEKFRPSEQELPLLCKKLRSLIEEIAL